MESLFIQLSDDVYILINKMCNKKCTLMTGFVVQGHTQIIYISLLLDILFSKNKTIKLYI